MAGLTIKCAVLAVILLCKNVLSTPPPGHEPTPGPVDEHPPKYEYGYVVSDKEGSSQGHVETRDGIYALGRYHITLPDGSAQKVTYLADDWGYHPLVTYSSSTEHGTSHTHFAMGDKAVAALKDAGSSAINLLAVPQQVQVVNAGASGHQDQTYNVAHAVESSTIATGSSSTVNHEVVSTTPQPASQIVSVQPTAISHQHDLTHVTGATASSQLTFAEQQEEIAKLEQVQQQLQLSLQHDSQPISATTPTTPITTASVTPHDVVDIVPNKQYVTSHEQQQVFSTLQSPLSTILLQETPQASVSVSAHDSQSENVHIVTPTPISNEQQDIYLSSPQQFAGNAILTNNTDDIFTVEGNQVQISSYLADTNKLFRFGDRIPSVERHSDEKIIDQIQQFAKLRILQDLQRNIPSSTLRPIVVAASPSSTTSLPSTGVSASGNINVVSYNNGDAGYNKISEQPQTTLQPPYEGTQSSSLPYISNQYLDSNSLSQTLAEKSDYISQYRFGGTSSGSFNIYSARPYNLIDHLAPLQAGLTLLSAPERPVPPVTEERKEDQTEFRTIVDVQKGIALEIPQEGQPSGGQYQALGYERRLVDSQAQQAVREPDPIIQEEKKTSLAVQQEIELRQVQDSLQELQQKILNDIDAHHEEEQRKQEEVANERQKHLDNLQKVAEITQELHSTTPVKYQAPEYLPPHEPSQSYDQYHGTANAYFTGESYQNIAVSTTGQDVQAEAQQVKEQNLNLSPPPIPPVIAEVEKPVFIEKPVAVETTKVVEVEKPVLIKETVPIETTKVVEIEKPVPVLQPYPVTITRLLHLERPVSVPEPYGVPQPVPIPYAVPQPIGIPYPQLIPYTEILPIPFKQYHPVYISTKTIPYKSTRSSDMKPSKRMPEPVFKDPKPELFQFSHSYHTIPLNMKSPFSHKTTHYRQQYKSHPSHLIVSGRNRNSLKNLRIEYGGFKPPLVPSTELTEEPKPSPYGSSVKEETR